MTWVNQNNHMGEKHQLENHILCTLLGLSPKPPQGEKHLEKHILRASDDMGCNQNNHMGQKHQLENHKLCTLSDHMGCHQNHHMVKNT